MAYISISSDFVFGGSIVLLLISLAMTLYQITLITYLPEIVNSADLSLTNSALKITTALAGVVAPLVFSVMFERKGIWTVLLVMIVVNIISIYIVVIFFPASKSTLVKRNEITRNKKRIAVSIRYLFEKKELLKIVSSTALINFSFAMMNTILIVFMTRDLKIEQSMAVTIGAFASIGAFLAPLITPSLMKRGGTFILIIGVIIPALPILGLGVLKLNFFTVCVILVFVTMSRNVGAIIRTTIQQTSIDEVIRGSVVGLMITITWGMNPLGQVVAGFISDLYGARSVIWIVIVLILLSNVLMYSLKKNIIIE